MALEKFSPGLLRRLELLKLRSRRAFLGTRQGGHLSLRRGHGLEFSDFRKYEPGDSPRHIAWGLYARSERLYVKRFQEEQDLPVFLLLDTSASMMQPKQDGKWERALGVALGLSYVALMQQDTVRMEAPGLFRSPSYHGGAAFHALARGIDKLRREPSATFAEDALRAVASVRYPGVIVLISDFLMPLESMRRIFNAMRAKNLDITALQILGPNDLDPLADLDYATVVDSETGEELEISLDRDARLQYRRALDLHFAELRAYLAQSGISLISTRSDEPLEDVLVRKLPKAGLLA